MLNYIFLSYEFIGQLTFVCAATLFKIQHLIEPDKKKTGQLNRFSNSHQKHVCTMLFFHMGESRHIKGLLFLMNNNEQFTVM